METYSAFSAKLAQAALAKKQFGDVMDCSYETEQAAKLSRLEAETVRCAQKLERAITEADSITDSLALAEHYHDAVLQIMKELRGSVDKLETLTSAEYWPYPGYGEILFSVG